MMNIKTTEIHTEELSLRGLTIKFFVKPDEESRGFTVFCKAFDNTDSLLWSTFLLDKDGKNRIFSSLQEAVAKTKSFFIAYKK